MPSHKSSSSEAAPPTRRVTLLTTERDEAITTLRKHLKPGTVVSTILRHVSASGISRSIDLYVIEKNQPVRLTWSAATALDWSYSRKREALRMDGCGMDMGFHVVHCLSAKILGDENALTHRWL